MQETLVNLFKQSQALKKNYLSREWGPSKVCVRALKEIARARAGRVCVPCCAQCVRW